MRSPNRLVALQHHDYRLVWAGNFTSVIGTQMQWVAINWHVYQLLQGTTLTVTLFGQTFALNVEALGLGGIGLARIIPIMLFALVGGTLADTRNRRTLLLWTNSAAALFALILAVLTFTGRATVGTLYLLTAATAATAAFSGPAFQSLVPNLVPTEHLTNAISLNSLAFQTASILGPALAGVVMGSTGVGWVYAINAASFVAIIVALLLLHHRGTAAARDTGLNWAAILEGWRFVRSAAHHLGDDDAGFCRHLLQFGPHHVATGGRTDSRGGRRKATGCWPPPMPWVRCWPAWCSRCGRTSTGRGLCC